jgi:hypothetical protein
MTTAFTRATDLCAKILFSLEAGNREAGLEHAEDLRILMQEDGSLTSLDRAHFELYAADVFFFCNRVSDGVDRVVEIIEMFPGECLPILELASIYVYIIHDNSGAERIIRCLQRRIDAGEFQPGALSFFRLQLLFYHSRIFIRHQTRDARQHNASINYWILCDAYRGKTKCGEIVSVANAKSPASAFKAFEALTLF